MVLGYKSTISCCVIQKHGNLVPKFCHLENEKKPQKYVVKIKQVKRCKAFKNGPHLINTSPFAFVVMFNCFEDRRKDKLILYMSTTTIF